ncbi:MAG: hypothetical protein V4850_05750 [Myxococcota bacterium]
MRVVALLAVAGGAPGCVSFYTAGQVGYVAELPVTEGPRHGGTGALHAGMGLRDNDVAFGVGAGVRGRFTAHEGIGDAGLHVYGLVPFYKDHDHVLAGFARAGFWLGGGHRGFRWSHSLEAGAAVCPFARDRGGVIGAGARRFRVRNTADGVCVLLTGLAEYDLTFGATKPAPWVGAQLGVGLFVF